MGQIDDSDGGTGGRIDDGLMVELTVELVVELAAKAHR